MRGVFILAGSELIEQFHVVIYLLGARADRARLPDLARGGRERRPRQEPDGARGAARLPGDQRVPRRPLVREQDGRRYATPIFLCLAAIVFADIAFAIDSIPAAFAITRDPLLIWMGNVFALLGMRALFVLVESLVARFRYLDETIAIVLGLVGVKLLIEDLVKIGPVASLGDDRGGLHGRHPALDPRRPARSRRRAAPPRARRSDAPGREFDSTNRASTSRPLTFFARDSLADLRKLTYLGPMDRRCHGWLAAVVAVLGLGAFAPIASAATAQITDDGTEQVLHLRRSRRRGQQPADRGRPGLPGRGAAARGRRNPRAHRGRRELPRVHGSATPSGSDGVSCFHASRGIDRVEVDLGDGDDQFEIISADVPVIVNGGEGNDLFDDMEQTNVPGPFAAHVQRWRPATTSSASASSRACPTTTRVARARTSSPTTTGR